MIYTPQEMSGGSGKKGNRTIMKCKYCGNELPDDAKFCVYCGGKLIGENTPAVNAAAPVKTTSKAAVLLKEASGKVGQVAGNAYENIKANAPGVIEKANQKLRENTNAVVSDFKEVMNDNQKEGYFSASERYAEKNDTYFAAGYEKDKASITVKDMKEAFDVLSSIEAHFANAEQAERVVNGLIAERDKKTKDSKTAMFVCLGGSLFAIYLAFKIGGGGILAMLILAAVLLGGALVSLKNAKNAPYEYGPKIEAAKQDALSEYAAGDKMSRVNFHSFSFIPADYWRSFCVEYMYKMMRDQRADSLKEALQMCDEYLHRLSIEDANNRLVAESQYQSRILEQTRQEAASAATAAWISAMRR